MQYAVLQYLLQYGGGLEGPASLPVYHHQGTTRASAQRCQSWVLALIRVI